MICSVSNKKCNVIGGVISELINLSFSNVELPALLKIVRVIPLFRFQR